MPPDVTIPVIVPDGDEESEKVMASIDLSGFPTIMESGNLQIAASTLGQSAAAAGGRRIDGADFLGENMRAMWGNAFANPTSIMAKALQTLSETGSGRTRAETNLPGNTSAPYVPPLSVNVEKQS